MTSRKALAALCAASLLIGLLSSLASATGPTDWTTRGGNGDRRQATAENFGAIAAQQTWTARVTDPERLGQALGATGSQPLFVGEYIYHMAGDALWRISPDGAATVIVGNINKIKNSAGEWEARPSTSGITYKEINGRPYLYFGTGDNRVCAQPLPEGLPRCLRISDLTAPEHRIVTTPLVLLVKDGDTVRHDITIMGDKQGRVWAIQGLATAANANGVVTTRQAVGGWVLASPVQIGEEDQLSFVWGNDRGGAGTIGAFRVIPQSDAQTLRLEDVWSEPVNTPAGVADGFAKDGPFIYASDIGGTIYRINATRFKVDTFAYATEAGPMFVNAAPAVDDKHIYFAIRNLGSAQANTTTPGRVIALNKATFTLDGGWVADLPAPANTNPLVWTSGPGVVLVGDTRGTLHAFSRDDGTPTPFAIALAGKTNAGLDTCTPITRLDLGAPGQAGEAWQTLTGIAEPIIASGSTGQGLMLVGLSGMEGPTLTGSLRAFRAGGSYNIAWRDTEKLAATLALNQPYEVKGDLTLAPWGGAPATDRPVGVEAYWVPDAAAQAAGAKVRLIKRTTVTLSPTRPTPYAVTFTPTEADGTAGAIRIFANPEQLLFAPAETGQLLRQASALADGKAATAYDAPLAAGDATPLTAKIAGADLPSNCAGALFELAATGWGDAMADNLLTAPVEIQQLVDLSVHSLSLPDDPLACDRSASVQASWVLSNPSSRTVKDVPYKVTVTSPAMNLTWDAIRGTIDLAPGDTPESTTFPRAGCGTVLTVRIELNLGPDPKPVREPDYTNNAATRDVQVAAQPASEWRGQPAGGMDVIIVPDDCQTNPDATSRQPCLNYPNLIMP